jgi:hypothetical protein
VEGITREEFNGLGKRLSECELLKPTVTRSEVDIQKIFANLDKIPETNSKIMREVNESNQKLLNKVIISMVCALLLMIAKEWVVK